MTEYLHPGVYIEEMPIRAKPIEGVATSTAAFVGPAARGPLRPMLLTGASEYRRRFGGGAGENDPMLDAVDAFFLNGGQRVFIARIVAADAAYAEAPCGPHFTLRAAGPGRRGARVFVLVGDSAARTATAGGAAPGRFRLRAAYYDEEPDGDPYAWLAGAPGAPAPAYAEDFDGLVVDPASPNHWRTRLAGSSLVSLVAAPTAPSDAAPSNGVYRLAGGSDGAPALGVADYEGEPAAPHGEPRGLAALADDACHDVSLVYAPGASVEVARAVVRHCEALRFRFAVVDAPAGAIGPRFDPRVDVADSSRAAVYAPWLRVAGPGGRTKLVPPGGAVAGIYARSDRERGVHRAPANEAVRGAAGLAAGIGADEAIALNQRHINVIREFPERGLVLWGARTLSSDPEWKYVNVRRLLIYIERSIVEGTQWVVFERNGEPLWAKVGEAVRRFLRECWTAGALQGRTERDAFFARCDRGTMTAADIENGRLLCEVGIAPLRPAEFVILRFGWRTASVD